MEYTELRDLNVCWRHLAGQTVVSWKKGYEPGPESAGEIYFVLRGRVRLVATTPEGQQKIVWYLGENCLFNETTVYALAYRRAMPQLFSASHFIHSAADDSLIGVIPRKRLEEEGRRDPDLLLNMVKSYAIKMSMLGFDLVSSTLLSPRARLFSYLAHNLIEGSSPPCFERTIRMAEMANLLSMHRISLYKVIEEAREDGILDCDRKKTRFVILDQDRFYGCLGR